MYAKFEDSTFCHFANADANLVSVVASYKAYYKSTWDGGSAKSGLVTSGLPLTVDFSQRTAIKTDLGEVHPMYTCDQSSPNFIAENTYDCH